MGIVEPRVVVKIPLTKLTSPTSKSSQRDDENVTKSSKQKGKNDKVKRSKNASKRSVIKLVTRIKSDHTNKLTFDSPNLSDVHKKQRSSLQKIEFINSKWDTRKRTKNRFSSNRVANVSNPFLHNHPVFGGGPLFNNGNKLTSDKLRTSGINENGISIRSANNRDCKITNNIDETMHYGKKLHHNTHSNLDVVNNAERENLTTEARCILTMQDERKKHRITQSRNMICQSKQQAENINNTSSSSISNVHINNLKEHKYEFDGKLTIPIDDEELIAANITYDVNEEDKTKRCLMPFKNETHHEISLTKQNRNQLANENSHLSFADLANKVKRDNILRQGTKEMCGLFNQREDNDAYCTTKNCHPKKLQLPQNSMISNIIPDNKTIILRKSKLNPSVVTRRQNNEKCSSSSMENYGATRSHEGELLCSNKGKYVDGNTVVCSTSRITKSIQQPPIDDEPIFPTTNVCKRTNGLFSGLNSLSTTINKDDNFARLAENVMQKDAKYLIENANSENMNLQGKCGNNRSETDLYDSTQQEKTYDYHSIKNSLAVNSNIEDTLCYSHSKTNVLRSQQNENERASSKSLREHCSISHEAETLNNDVHMANNIGQLQQHHNKNCHQQEKQHKTCSESECSLNGKNSYCEVNCPENKVASTSDLYRTSQHNQLHPAIFREPMITNGLSDDMTNITAHNSASCDIHNLNKIYPKVKEWQTANIQHLNTSSRTEKPGNGFDKIGQCCDKNNITDIHTPQKAKKNQDIKLNDNVECKHCFEEPCDDHTSSEINNTAFNKETLENSMMVNGLHTKKHEVLKGENKNIPIQIKGRQSNYPRTKAKVCMKKGLSSSSLASRSSSTVYRSNNRFSKASSSDDSSSSSEDEGCIQEETEQSSIKGLDKQQNQTNDANTFPRKHHKGTNQSSQWCFKLNSSNEFDGNGIKTKDLDEPSVYQSPALINNSDGHPSFTKDKSREASISSRGSPSLNVNKVKLALNYNTPSATITRFDLKSPDDQWMFCRERGCTFWTRKPERMERHERCHLPDTKYYKCPDCKEFTKFYSLAKMLKHDRKAHTGVQDYECRVCEAEVTDITVHMKVRTKM